MIRQETDLYIKACMKSWLLCESVVHMEATSNEPRADLIRECRECAQSCFTLVCKLVSNSDDIADHVFNCLLHCRQCIAECEKYDHVEDIAFCASVCSVCASAMKDLAVFHLN